MDNNIHEIAKLLRYYSLTSTTVAGSGHPSSCLSAADVMAELFFGGHFKADLDDPSFPNNDRLIFSKGHAAPLLYALYAVAGKVSEDELMTLRHFESSFEGHPTLAFKYTETATGSLGQGLSVGVGMSLHAKSKEFGFRTYVLLGDSELAEGSCYEAMALASFYHLDNLVAIVDINRLGQRGETMHGHDIDSYRKKFEAFGWQVFEVDGHDVMEVKEALEKAVLSSGKPIAILAKTLKGKGVSFVEDKDGWHGKPLSWEDLDKAIAEVGEIDKGLVGKVVYPDTIKQSHVAELPEAIAISEYALGDMVATRKAYGSALKNLDDAFGNFVVLDAETSNSTYADTIKKQDANKFYEMFIAEQNMVGVALGFSRRGVVPFVSTFAAFFSRAFDQIRMSQYSDGNIKFVGSHAGCSIGEDGASQMGLEDISMFRSVRGMTVLYPSDAISTERLVHVSAKHHGNVYLRTTRKETPVIYSPEETFEIGGSKTVRSSVNDAVTIVAAGVTLHEAIAAADVLKEEGVFVRVVDMYSVKPLDKKTLNTCAFETKALLVVEDHYPEGGLYEAVSSALNKSFVPVYGLAVTKLPRSGKPSELLAFEKIDKTAIIEKVKKIINSL